MIEKELENECLDWLNREFGFFFKKNTVGIYDEKAKAYRKKGKYDISGVSDSIGIYKGFFIAIEFKIKPKKPSHEQTVFINKINREGGFARCCYSLEEVKDFCNEIRAKTEQSRVD